MKYNYNWQRYGHYVFKLIKRNYRGYKAKRFVFPCTNQNIWIPNQFLEEDGTVKKDTNIDFVFRDKRKIELWKEGLISCAKTQRKTELQLLNEFYKKVK